jgi:hypothetical protein
MHLLNFPMRATRSAYLILFDMKPPYRPMLAETNAVQQRADLQEARGVWKYPTALDGPRSRTEASEPIVIRTELPLTAFQTTAASSDRERRQPEGKQPFGRSSGRWKNLKWILKRPLM